ncbi:MAG: bifunctional protein-disulfide isomerase/oxidoreductase DsbC [Paraglaciecola sp.]|uniref:bifunctional protein-disulfide isomerase/oxidoreductase DsbC n=1 Tax=Pseudomonadati TaxID=3379134 RepID=UPI00273E1E9D|nr:bifunctional protein-disulfide isomerase/oxidoreductase DsbC [Paraglaciecola sp.]MDP5032883.1 bifunctional protein-disulfide isomerase/oxidoreductase DsbC [Paraglaciecola sp.]MDP5132817.1 bifunctional protein-disulfide isomerase/oxidoreductase DsbC [Paraglaciecola sp.]
MKNWFKHSALGLALVLSGAVLASSQVDNFDAVKQKIQSTLGMKVSSIADSPITGLLQLETDKGLFYTSKDGKFLLQARVYNLDAGMRNETELALSKMRLAGVEEFKDSVIEYKAKNEKYVVDVFTDITCGYCRKLHGEMDKYNDLGITVRYLAYPREGLRGQTYKNMVSVWCASDPQEAMDDAKNGQTVASKVCENKVAEQYAFGQQIGVNGTPNIILPDGSLIPGYQPPNLLEQALKAL